MKPWKCNECERTFSKAGLGRHFQVSGHGEVVVQEERKLKRAPVRRSYKFKRSVLQEIDVLRKEGVHNAVSIVSRRHAGLQDTSVVSKWDKMREVIFARASMRIKGTKSRYRLSRGRWHQLEIELYDRFCFRRFCQRKVRYHTHT